MQANSPLQISIDPDFLRILVNEEIKKISETNIDIGTWWDLERLERETCRKRDWLKKNILLNPNFREQMKLISNECRDGRWLFRGKEMKFFLEEHFEQINK
ncbi:DUF771 domain-containing protein [Paenibacillus campi]|uniref:DUF771 domain-containing protein n=1 Tax=Paenibacillus campi TaxID=3106031 RepID=UPI002AFE1774|nr:DUF771 domain-containing protein [Paenibacillus sp. SGZ-1014]